MLPFTSRLPPIFHSNSSKQADSAAAASAATSSSSSPRRREHPAHAHAVAPAFKSRELPLYGNPNQHPNPSSHYFPSVPAAERELMRKRALPPPPLQSYHSTVAARDAALPPLPPEHTSQPASQRRRREEDWNPAAELLEADDRDDDRHDSDTEMERERDDASSTGARDEGPAKKRSRTLTTAHQTAVLTALLAKTRFPSTETREQVGLEIGMSARRVQIWFQNRRQSQKRAREARDRETTDGTSPTAGSPHYPVGHNSAQDFLSNDPYRHSHRYSTHSTSTALSRQTSSDSLASMASFASAKTSQTSHSAYHHRPAELAPRFPAESTPSESDSYRRNHQWAAGSVFPSPPASSTHRSFAAAPASRVEMGGRDQAQGRQDSHSTGSHSHNEFRLPSLSSVVGSALPQSAPHVELPTSSRAISPELFAYQPPPFSSTRSPDRTSLAHLVSSRSTPSSSMTTIPRFDADDFSRLRISGSSSSSTVGPSSQHPGRLSLTPSANGEDVLDHAMETMYRPARVNPPRSSLPTLRLQPVRAFDHLSRPTGSEADAALLAPINPIRSQQSSLFSKQSIRLPPISTIASYSSHSSRSSNASNTTVTQLPSPTSPTDTSFPQSVSQVTSSSFPNPNAPPPQSGLAHRSSQHSRSSVSTNTSALTHASSNNSTQQRTPARSSISSFDTYGSGGPSLASSRTSFSSTSFSNEVNEEWEKHSSSLGGSMRLGSMTGRKLDAAPIRAPPALSQPPARRDVAFEDPWDGKRGERRGSERKGSERRGSDEMEGVGDQI